MQDEELPVRAPALVMARKSHGRPERPSLAGSFMFSPRLKTHPALERLTEISSEFTAKTRLVENAVDTEKKEVRLSFDNGYSVVIEGTGDARVESF